MERLFIFKKEEYKDVQKYGKKIWRDCSIFYFLR